MVEAVHRRSRCDTEDQVELPVASMTSDKKAGRQPAASRGKNMTTDL